MKKFIPFLAFLSLFSVIVFQPALADKGYIAPGYPASDYSITAEDKTYFFFLRDAILHGNKEWIADQIDFPIAYGQRGRRGKLKTREEFLNRYEEFFNSNVREEVEKQTPEELFKNWRGISIRGGLIWVEPPEEGGKIRYSIITIPAAYNYELEGKTLTPAQHKKELARGWEAENKISLEGNWVISESLGVPGGMTDDIGRDSIKTALEIIGKSVSVEGKNVKLYDASLCRITSKKNEDLKDEFGNSGGSYEDFGIKPLPLDWNHYAVTYVKMKCRPADPDGYDQMFMIANDGQLVLLSVKIAWVALKLVPNTTP
jgi:hypothetical protein